MMLAPNTAARTEARPVLTTTRDWVIPPKPKPGRKPKAAAPPAASTFVATSPEADLAEVRLFSAQPWSSLG